MEVERPSLTFPTAFCCNCSSLECTDEVQHTRVTRFFGIGGTETTFHLSLPVCKACRRTMRRRPAGLFSALLVFVILAAAWFLLFFVLGRTTNLPLWIADHRFGISMLLGAIFTFVFYRLRSARPPRTSFYQPVRIKQAKLKIASVMDGPGHVEFMKLAFTNPDYLNVFVNANQDAIKAGHLAVVKA